MSERGVPDWASALRCTASVSADRLAAPGGTVSGTSSDTTVLVGT